MLPIHWWWWWWKADGNLDFVFSFFVFWMHVPRFISNANDFMWFIQFIFFFTAILSFVFWIPGFLFFRWLLTIYDSNYELGFSRIKYPIISTKGREISIFHVDRKKFAFKLTFLNTWIHTATKYKKRFHFFLWQNGLIANSKSKMKKKIIWNEKERIITLY